MWHLTPPKGCSKYSVMLQKTVKTIDIVYEMYKECREVGDQEYAEKGSARLGTYCERLRRSGDHCHYILFTYISL